MSDTELDLAAMRDRFVDVMDAIEGVYLRRLPPITTLVVRTMNSVYRVVVARRGEVFVQGGVSFPEPTSAEVAGASIGGSSLKVGWIGVGVLMQIRSEDRLVLTSPVCGIIVEQASGAVENYSALNFPVR